MDCANQNNALVKPLLIGFLPLFFPHLAVELNSLKCPPKELTGGLIFWDVPG